MLIYKIVFENSFWMNRVQEKGRFHSSQYAECLQQVRYLNKAKQKTENKERKWIKNKTKEKSL